MTTIQTSAVVACRVLGVYLIMTWLGIIPVYGHQLFGERSLVGSLLWCALLLAVQFVLVAILWSLSPWIAKYMLADVGDESASLSAATMEQIQAVAISVLGIFFMVHAFPAILIMILEYFGTPGIATDAGMQSMFRTGVIKAVVMRLTEMGLGIWLFFGASSFVRVFQGFYSSKAD